MEKFYKESGFGKGFEGNKISKIEFPYLKDGKIEHIDFLVMKSFRMPCKAKESVENYGLAREAGLKLETNSEHGDNSGMHVYYYDSEKEKVLMSPLNINGWTALPNSWNYSKDAEKYSGNQMTIYQQQWEELIDTFIKEVTKATEKNIHLNCDCYMIMVRKIDEEFEFDFIIGDYENVKKSEKNKETLKKENLSQAKIFLLDFLSTYIDKNNETVLSESLNRISDWRM
ncbi:MAG: hypothetical protein WA055_00070 [Candidatus Moraniibacteriota bacterium]